MIIRKKEDKKTRFVTYLSKLENEYIRNKVIETGLTESQVIAIIIRDAINSQKNKKK